MEAGEARSFYDASMRRCGVDVPSCLRARLQMLQANVRLLNFTPATLYRALSVLEQWQLAP